MSTYSALIENPYTMHFGAVSKGGVEMLGNTVLYHSTVLPLGAMASHKRILNVDNGPGSNGLRGGIKQYSAKVTTGPWLETYGGPAGYRRGFHSSDFETEAQHAQIGAIGKHRGEFGAEIPFDDDRDEKGNPMGTSGASTWISNTKATHTNFGVVSKNDTAFKLLQPRLSRDQLLKYRQQWTCDKESSRNLRFQTESRIAGNAVGGKFSTSTLRILPGTPKSLEEYRRRLVEMYGVFAISALRLAMGTEGMPCKEFRERIQTVGVDIKPYELSQTIAYITPSATDVSSKELEGFLLLVKGHTDGFSAQAVSNAFFNLCNTSEEGATLPLNSLLCAIDADEFPEIAQGFERFLPAYIGDAQEVTVHHFIEFHGDLHASSPRAYQEMLSAVWKV